MYDFKVTNGMTSPPKIPLDPYRGMAIGTTTDGIKIIASARDIGNIAAGYEAGVNGINWFLARFAFDLYQTRSNYKSGKQHKFRFVKESPSTQKAEMLGWTMGYDYFLQITGNRWYSEY